MLLIVVRREGPPQLPPALWPPRLSLLSLTIPLLHAAPVSPAFPPSCFLSSVRFKFLLPTPPEWAFLDPPAPACTDSIQTCRAGFSSPWNTGLVFPQALDSLAPWGSGYPEDGKVRPPFTVPLTFSASVSLRTVFQSYKSDPERHSQEQEQDLSPSSATNKI